MSDYPERISISPVHRQKHDDDFYLVDRKAFPGKGTEYVRAYRVEELEAKLKKALGALGDIFDGEPEWPDDPDKELSWCRNRARGAYAELTGGKDE